MFDRGLTVVFSKRHAAGVKSYPQRRKPPAFETGAALPVNCWDWPVGRLRCARLLSTLHYRERNYWTKILTISDYQSRGQAAATSL
jgi:hypothetical protein